MINSIFCHSRPLMASSEANNPSVGDLLGCIDSLNYLRAENCTDEMINSFVEFNKPIN